MTVTVVGEVGGEELPVLSPWLTSLMGETTMSFMN